MGELTKCKCLHCDGMIEFDADAAGQETPCPHCGALTWVDLPDRFSFLTGRRKPAPMPLDVPKPAHPAPAPKVPPVPPKKRIAAGEDFSGLMLVFGIVFILGGGLLGGEGFLKELHEESRLEVSAIRQAANYLELFGGLITCAIGFLMLGVWQVLKLLRASNALQIVTKE